jgi:hypothetical protein
MMGCWLKISFKFSIHSNQMLREVEKDVVAYDFYHFVK